MIFDWLYVIYNKQYHIVLFVNCALHILILNIYNKIYTYTHRHIFFRKPVYPTEPTSEILTRCPVNFYANQSLTAEAQIALVRIEVTSVSSPCSTISWGLRHEENSLHSPK